MLYTILYYYVRLLDGFRCYIYIYIIHGAFLDGIWIPINRWDNHYSNRSGEYDLK
jgi:hypothetical protein